VNDLNKLKAFQSVSRYTTLMWNDAV